MMSFLVTLAAGLDNDLFSLAYAEKKEQQEYHLVRHMSLLFDNSGPDLYPGAAFIKELEHLIKNFDIHLTLMEVRSSLMTT